MAHLLFLDVNESAFQTMQLALDLGHRASIIRSEAFQMYVVTNEVRRTLDRAAHNIALPRTSDKAAMIEAVAALHTDDPLDGAIGQLEAAIEAGAVACERAAIRFTAAAGVANARNKARTRAMLEEAGLAVARCGVAHEIAEALEIASRLGYPLVVKPVSGMDSMLAFRVDDAADLHQAMAANLDEPKNMSPQLAEQLSRGVLVEAHLPGELVSAELALVDGEARHFMICGRSRGRFNECVEMGAALPTALSPQQETRCFKFAEAACRAVGLDFGVFHVELMIDGLTPALVEVNPRPMGGIMTSMFERVTGRSFSEIIIETYLGRLPEAGAGRPRGTVTARKVMPLADGKIPGEADFSGLATATENLVAVHDYGMTPGRVVTKNQVLARLVVHGPGWAATMAEADRLLDRVEAMLGLPIHKSRPAEIH